MRRAATHRPPARRLRVGERDIIFRGQNRPDYAKEIIEYAVTLILALSLALLLNTYVGRMLRVDGPSMLPTFHTNEIALMGKFEYYSHPPKRGDIVVVKYPASSNYYIKRVIAVAGEHMQIIGGRVHIDGRPLTEPYLNAPHTPGEDTAYITDIVVPADSVFVMGDNRGDSRDSRYPTVGAIPLKNVLGRVYAIAFPFSEARKTTEYTGVLAQ